MSEIESREVSFTLAELHHIHECLRSTRDSYDRAGKRAYLTDANPSARTKIERAVGSW